MGELTAIEADDLNVDVRRAFENERDAPAATLVFHAFLLAHGDATALSRDEAADLFSRALFAPETAPAELVTRLDDLYPDVYAVHPYRRAQYVLPVLECLYYREAQSKEAATLQAFEALERMLDEGEETP